MMKTAAQTLTRFAATFARLRVCAVASCIAENYWDTE
jgi:hypothetical protein